MPAILLIMMQFIFAGCADRPIPSVEPFDEHRPTTSHPQLRCLQELAIVDDRVGVNLVESQSLGFRTVIHDIGRVPESVQRKLDSLTAKTSGPRLMYSMDPSLHTVRNQGNTDWVGDVVAIIQSAPSHSVVLLIDKLSMSNLKLILSALGDSNLTVSLFVPLGLLAYTYQSIEDYREFVDHYFYHISGFWIPSAHAFQGPLSQNPFRSWTSGLALLNFLTGESSIGSPIPRRDLDILSLEELRDDIIIMMSPFHDSLDCIEPHSQTNCTNIKRVSEFGTLSRNQLDEFITAFKDKYKFINGFGLSSYSAIPTSWEPSAQAVLCCS